VLDSCGEPLAEQTRSRTRWLKRKSGLLRQVIDNFYAELHLVCSFWRGFIDVLNRGGGDVDELCKAIRKYVRSALFQGPPARIPAGVTMGRATSRKELARHFRRRRYFPDILSANLAIDEVMRVPVEESRTKWGAYELGSYVMWSTFDPAGGRPFAIANLTSRLLRGRLGLPGRRSRYPVLTLEYELPRGQPAYLPTVAEAYAGNTWLVFFRTSSEEEVDSGFSLTQPHDDLALRHAGMPEVVHAPITGAALSYSPAEID
jgi:hypothetical protein